MDVLFFLNIHKIIYAVYNMILAYFVHLVVDIFIVVHIFVKRVSDWINSLNFYSSKAYIYLLDYSIFYIIGIIIWRSKVITIREPVQIDRVLLNDIDVCNIGVVNILNCNKSVFYKIYVIDEVFLVYGISIVYILFKLNDVNYSTNLPLIGYS